MFIIFIYIDLVFLVCSLTFGTQQLKLLTPGWCCSIFIGQQRDFFFFFFGARAVSVSSYTKYGQLGARQVSIQFSTAIN